MDIISKVFDFIGLDKLYAFFEELLTFYTNPLKFYSNYFKKSTREKISQILVYSIFVVVLMAVFINDRPILELIKAFITGIARLFVVILILFISNFLVYRFNKKHLKLENIITFAFLSQILLAPILLIFYGLFIAHENYNYFFIYNILDVALFIYIFAFSSRIFNLKTSYVLLSICFNYLLLNITTFVSFNLSIDKFTTGDTF